MLLRVILEALRRRWRQKLVGLATVAFGVAVFAALLHLWAQGRDELALDLRGYGANLAVTARDGGGALRESDVPLLDTIFWHNNVVALAPQLPVTVQARDRRVTLVGAWLSRDREGHGKTGLVALHPSWSEPGALQGRMPLDSEDAVVAGARAAKLLGLREGDELDVSRDGLSVRLRVAGVLRTGDAWDERLVAPLHVAQRLAGEAQAVARVEMGVLAKPDDGLLERDPATLTWREQETIACSPYLSTVARQIEKAWPASVAAPVSRVADAERIYRSRLEAVLALFAALSAALTALGVHAAVRAALIERRREVGLMKALGARTSTIAALFFGEGLLLGACGAVLGTGLGWALASALSGVVFARPLAFQPAVLPLMLVAGLAVSAAGCALALRRTLRSDALALLGA